ncbi:hypothetical protein O9929_16675 [Vibrio lentus]|nr:hypothetical protein [Vibrio lentus]
MRTPNNEQKLALLKTTLKRLKPKSPSRLKKWGKGTRFNDADRWRGFVCHGFLPQQKYASKETRYQSLGQSIKVRILTLSS